VQIIMFHQISKQSIHSLHVLTNCRDDLQHQTLKDSFDCLLFHNVQFSKQVIV